MADENKNTQPTWLGIPTQTIQVEDPSKNNALFEFGNQPLDPNQKDYQSPAIQQDIIFLRQLALENRPFDGQAASRFLLIKQSLRPDEIQKIIPASSYANLLQKDAEFARSQPSENPSEALAHQQQEALANQKKIEDSKIYIEFYNEREKPKIASENENSQEKGPQINGVDKIRGG
jgi:hypothetical protein